MTELTSRQRAALSQMGVQPLALRRTKAPLALIDPQGRATAEHPLVQDLLTLLELPAEQLLCATEEQAAPAKRYWVLGRTLPATATHLYSPSLDKPLSADEKRRLWRSLQRWL
ncbi:DNA polymerase III subunit psi [Ferrimonas balearica]|uniref:DNA polymerase III subunit psi n=1 Tax=Ferrimonas balearica TaxID=44012 RepID=UPI001C99AFC8|nr:DNA polymerase III subunit psi [Ferrimonas balearica]MBY5990513.1 DNA polymerase III subunit psi [Ferrimonas balearica]